MNKEQAIAALQVEQREYEPGRDSYEVLNDAIEILCSLPDETPTYSREGTMTELEWCENGKADIGPMAGDTAHWRATGQVINGEIYWDVTASTPSRFVLRVSDEDSTEQVWLGHRPTLDEVQSLAQRLQNVLDLPDDSPTVLTREKLEEVQNRDVTPCHIGCDCGERRVARRFIDALLALGPVVAEGPVQCPTKHGRTWNGGTANSMWPHGYISDYCSDCGTRLQGGENGTRNL